ncbi:hypothetical protein PR048_000584 [Dryococelus australis]|uniref:Uncharacterized protein n=1 Tax=Dryococelus australis TaxID=614101 RepID=A0ABQ9IF28_9NEOP|nr:hypothetical protein PR048_000584 [Dryococelus australis]
MVVTKDSKPQRQVTAPGGSQESVTRARDYPRRLLQPLCFMHVYRLFMVKKADPVEENFGGATFNLGQRSIQHLESPTSEERYTSFDSRRVPVRHPLQGFQPAEGELLEVHPVTYGRGGAGELFLHTTPEMDGFTTSADLQRIVPEPTPSEFCQQDILQPLTSKSRLPFRSSSVDAISMSRVTLCVLGQAAGTQVPDPVHALSFRSTGGHLVRHELVSLRASIGPNQYRHESVLGGVGLGWSRSWVESVLGGVGPGLSRSWSESVLVHCGAATSLDLLPRRPTHCRNPVMEPPVATLGTGLPARSTCSLQQQHNFNHLEKIHRQRPPRFSQLNVRIQTHPGIEPGSTNYRGLLTDNWCVVGIDGAALECKGGGNGSTPRKPFGKRYRPGANPPGIEPGLPWWEAIALATAPPLPPCAVAPSVGGIRSYQLSIFNTPSSTQQEVPGTETCKALPSWALLDPGRNTSGPDQAQLIRPVGSNAARNSSIGMATAISNGAFSSRGNCGPTAYSQP